MVGVSCKSNSFPSSEFNFTINNAIEAKFMLNCMSSSPFDSDTILKWFSVEDPSRLLVDGLDSIHLCTSGEPESSSSKEETQSSRSTALPSPSSSGQALLSSIPVLVGSEVVQLSVPIDLLCALLLTNGKPQEQYSLQDVVLASDNLKRFREVASVSTVSSTNTGSVQETRLPTECVVQSEVDIVSMCLDPDGASLVQEMIVKASDLEKKLIISQISTAAVIICINTHGCRVVQKALEYGTAELNYRLFKAIPAFKLVDLCMDVNGNHVMQKFVETLPHSALHEIVMVITDPVSHMEAAGGPLCTVSRLSLHSYGCRVIQRLLVRCAEEDRSTLMGFIISAYPDLVCDQFGNYVAQHSLEHSGEVEKRSIISTLTLMDIAGLCCNKFASNVVEKAVRSNLNDKTVLHRLISTTIRNDDILLSLMKDKYGNYVVKAICDLSQTDFPEVVYVKNVLIANSATIKKYTYGFHLVEKLERGANGNRNRADSGLSQNSGGDKDRRRRGGGNSRAGEHLQARNKSSLQGACTKLM